MAAQGPAGTFEAFVGNDYYPLLSTIVCSTPPTAILMTAFAAALDALFADPNIATDATYTPSGGGPVSVRVIARSPDEIVGFGDTRIHAATAVFDVRVSEISTPTDGDILEVGGEAFVVQGQPERDGDRLIWTLDTRQA